MEEFIPFFIGLLKSDPMKAVVVMLMLLCGAMFLELKRRFSKDITRFETNLSDFTKKLNAWETEIRIHTKQTGTYLLKHSDDMGKATKAINGDFLKVHESFLNMKENVISEIEKLKTFAAALERQFLLIAQKCDLTVESIEAKFGRIIEIKKDLQILNGKVLLIEENNGKNTIRVAKHDEHLGNIAKTLTETKTTLQNLQFEIHKSKKGK